MSPSRVRSVVLSVGIITGLIAAGFMTGQAAALPLRRREFNPSGAWCWFGDPRAVYYQGAHRRTYVGWVSGAGDIQVGSYDHDTGQRVVTTVKARFQIDDHANPSLLVRPDGRLMVFWSGHFGSAMYYRRSVNPEDISSWEPERTVPHQHARDIWLHLPQPDTAVGGSQPHLAAVARRELQPDLLDLHRRAHLGAGTDADQRSEPASLRENRQQRRRHLPPGVHRGAPP
jgi:hypothetical protein